MRPLLCGLVNKGTAPGWTWSEGTEYTGIRLTGVAVPSAVAQWCVLPPPVQIGELPAEACRVRGWSVSQPKHLFVPVRRCVGWIKCSTRTGRLSVGVKAWAEVPSLFRIESIEKGPLNFTSGLIWTVLRGAGSREWRGLGGQLRFLVSSLEARTGKRWRISKKCSCTISVVICLQSSVQYTSLRLIVPGTRIWKANSTHEFYLQPFVCLI